MECNLWMIKWIETLPMTMQRGDEGKLWDMDPDLFLKVPTCYVLLCPDQTSKVCIHPVQNKYHLPSSAHIISNRLHELTIHEGGGIWHWFKECKCESDSEHCLGIQKQDQMQHGHAINKAVQRRSLPGWINKNSPMTAMRKTPCKGTFFVPSSAVLPIRN